MRRQNHGYSFAITVRPKQRAELGRYDMERNFLMIRFLSLDETGTKLNISQIQIPQDLITEEDLRTFLESLEVETNTGECVDGLLTFYVHLS
jgi:hypothetical protein